MTNSKIILNKRMISLFAILGVLVIVIFIIAGYYLFTSKQEKVIPTTPKINVEPDRVYDKTEDSNAEYPTNIKPLPPIPAPPE